MKSLLSYCLVTGFFAATTSEILSAPRAESYARKEKENLQGTWVVVSTKGFSRDLPAAELRTLALTFKDNHVISKYDNKTAAATYRLILNEAGPSQIDFAVTQGPEAVKDKTLHGIYLLEGGTLKILYRDPGQPRPATFMVEDEPGVHTLFLKKK